MTEAEALAIRKQGIVADGLLTLYYPTFTLADIESAVTRLEANDEAGVIADILTVSDADNSEIEADVMAIKEGLD